MAMVLSPVVRRMLNDSGIDPATIAGTGLNGRITRDDVQKAIELRGLAPRAPQSAAPAPAEQKPEEKK